MELPESMEEGKNHHPSFEDDTNNRLTYLLYKGKTFLKYYFTNE